MFKLLMGSCIVMSATFLVAQDSHIATGTWSWNGKDGAGGLLLVFQEGKEARFQLECNRGGPSYNSGFLEGKMTIHGSSGVFKSNENGPCEILFEFRKNRVLVKHNNEAWECGFGYGVLATGDYKCNSHKRPKFYMGDSRNSETRRE